MQLSTKPACLIRLPYISFLSFTKGLKQVNEDLMWFWHLRDERQDSGEQGVNKGNCSNCTCFCYCVCHCLMIAWGREYNSQQLPPVLQSLSGIQIEQIPLMGPQVHWFYLFILLTFDPIQWVFSYSIFQFHNFHLFLFYKSYFFD